MERKLHDYFENETMPEELSRSIEQSLTVNRKSVGCPRWTRVAAVAASLVLILAMAFSGDVTTAFAEVYNFFIHTQNPDVTEPLGRLEDGSVVSYAGVIDNSTNAIVDGIWSTPNMKEPVTVEDGRLIFIANGEHLDITDLCSEDEAYVYVLQDNTGIQHYFIIGGTPETCGYQIFIQNPSEEYGGWICGASVGAVTRSSGWHIRGWVYDGKEKVGHPWSLIDNTEPENEILIPGGPIG